MKNLTIKDLEKCMSILCDFITKNIDVYPVTEEINAEFLALYNEYEFIYNQLIYQGLTHEELSKSLPSIKVADEAKFGQWWIERISSRKPEHFYVN